MKKALLVLLTAGFIAALFVSQGIFAAEEGTHKYVGAKKCKVCHMSKKKGAQFTKWQESAHSKAYETLTSDKAKEVYAKAVPGGSENPAESEKCLSCHSTGYGKGAELFTDTFDKTEGVGCEACHGPGSDYMKMSVMKDQAKAVSAGLVIPNADTCTGCHNEKSPTFTEFDFDSFYQKIAHPYPSE
ncbi:MAG: multiheme c-type cytochrome [Candidatus Glassbacteria bacterium]